jgi:hypothetical protein
MKFGMPHGMVLKITHLLPEFLALFISISICFDPTLDTEIRRACYTRKFLLQLSNTPSVQMVSLYEKLRVVEKVEPGQN